MAASCIFCSIASGESPSLVVHADEHAVAFLDVNPFTTGHTLVVPRRHVVGMLDEGAGQAMSQLAPALQVVSAMLAERLPADGINLFSATGPVAGQTVFHLHVHVLPRTAGDGLIKLPHQRLPVTEDLTQTHGRLTA